MKVPLYILWVLSLVCTACLIGGCGSGAIKFGGDGGVTTPVLSVFPGDTENDLVWTDSGDRYELFRDGSRIFDGSETSYRDIDLSNGTRYCYQVRSLDQSGATRSPFSNDECATPMDTPILTATALSLAATLNWNAVTGASSYNLYQFVPSSSASADVVKAEEGSDVLIAGDIPSNVTSYYVTGLSNNCVTYEYKVIPVDADGNESAADIQYASVMPDTLGFLDPTFADGTPLILTVAGDFTEVAVRDDGVILALRSGDERKLIGFADDGEMLWEIEFGGSLDHEMTQANAFAIDEEGRIVVVGARSSGAKACRLIPDGDSYAFDDAGFSDGTYDGCSEFAMENTLAWDVAHDSLGRIVVAGEAGAAASDAALWRLNDSGTLDTSFASTGIYVYEPPGVDESLARSVVVAFNADAENLYAAGRGSSVALGDYTLLLALNEMGVLIDAIALTSADGGSSFNMALAPNGNLLVGGFDEGAHLGFVWGFTTTPALESTGVLMWNPTTSARPLVVNVDCADRLLVGGLMDIAGDDYGYAFRALSESTIRDDTFADNGWYLYSPGAGMDYVRAIAIDPLGRLVVAGGIEGAVTVQPVIWRLQ